MSATGRNLEGAERRADDFYSTPAWCVRALLKGCALPGGLWLEPTAGNGAIAREVLKHRGDVRWYLNESREAEADKLRAITGRYAPWRVRIGDFLNYKPYPPVAKFDVALGNPPYALALEIIRHAMTMSRVVCMLLRINFLASQKRAAWMRENTPSIYVLPKRPSFTDKGTDACEYAWFCWGLDHVSQINILDLKDCKDE